MDAQKVTSEPKQPNLQVSKSLAGHHSPMTGEAEPAFDGPPDLAFERFPIPWVKVVPAQCATLGHNQGSARLEIQFGKCHLCVRTSIRQLNRVSRRVCRAEEARVLREIKECIGKIQKGRTKIPPERPIPIDRKLRENLYRPFVRRNRSFKVFRTAGLLQGNAPIHPSRTKRIQHDWVELSLCINLKLPVRMNASTPGGKSKRVFKLRDGRIVAPYRLGEPEFYARSLRCISSVHPNDGPRLPSGRICTVQECQGSIIALNRIPTRYGVAAHLEALSLAQPRTCFRIH